jgi:DNA (cytosine-5)-methyltransferase 1
VFVVASARDDINPAEILFEFEGVRRDTPQSRETRESVAGTIAARFGISRNNIEECVSVVGALDTECGGTKMNHQTIASGHIFPVKSFYESSLAQYREDTVSGTIKASGGVAGGGSETFLAQPVAVYENHPADSRVKEMGEVCSTVVSRWGTGGGNLPMVSQPIPINTMNALRSADADPSTGCGIGEAGEAMFTITRGEHHAVAQPIAFNIAPGKGELKDDIHVTDAHISKTIDASGSNPSMHQGGAAIVSPTLTASNDPSRSPQSTEVTNQVAAIHSVSMAVRRLTPVECERLQGFPDGYTNIPWRKAAESPDGPRYKALGNSWAVPVVAWIGQRIQNQIK